MRRLTAEMYTLFTVSWMYFLDTILSEKLVRIKARVVCTLNGAGQKQQLHPFMSI